MAYGSVNTPGAAGRELKAVRRRVESLEKSLVGLEKLTGGTDPTAQTEAQVGQVYLNTATGQEFVCTAVTEDGTVWEERREETSQVDALCTRVERLEKALTGKETLTGGTDPTAQTPAQPGQEYINTATGKEFTCTGVTEEGTQWLEKLTGGGDPTAQTEAQVGQVYLNTATGQEFVCTAVTEDGTVWEERTVSPVQLNIFAAGAQPPEDTRLLWIDTDAAAGGLKYWDGTGWVHVPVAYT